MSESHDKRSPDAITSAAGADTPRNVAAAKPPKDVVFLHSPTEDGRGVRVIRAREEGGEVGVEVGEVRALEHGKPIHGDVLKLTPRAGAPRLCDVDVVHASAEGARTGAVARVRTSGGPAQVSSTAYRDSWERIFGEPTKTPELPN